MGKGGGAATNVATDPRLACFVVTCAVSAFFLLLGAAHIVYRCMLAYGTAETSTESVTTMDTLLGNLGPVTVALSFSPRWHWAILLSLHGALFGWFAAQLVKRSRWAADVVLSCYLVYGLASVALVTFESRTWWLAVVGASLVASLAVARQRARKLEMAEIVFGPIAGGGGGGNGGAPLNGTSPSARAARTASHGRSLSTSQRASAAAAGGEAHEEAIALMAFNEGSASKLRRAPFTT